MSPEIHFVGTCLFFKAFSASKISNLSENCGSLCSKKINAFDHATQGQRKILQSRNLNIKIKGYKLSTFFKDLEIQILSP